MGALKFLWAQQDKVAALSGSIVATIDVGRDVRQRDFRTWSEALLNSLIFQATEEQLRDSSIPAASFPAHARFEMI
jgi:hypothetical protein